MKIEKKADAEASVLRLKDIRSGEAFAFKATADTYVCILLPAGIVEDYPYTYLYTSIGEGRNFVLGKERNGDQVVVRVQSTLTYRVVN
jgi:hypothetical protein